ncbi:hypothetical protein ABZ897_06855 [Nonomuraea sp. NPDC046802]|uniref:hypothetical protein n=1 Tax=Nonomuraea sp. NPDC046802 TaxID=3154919 RepID=UPI00340E9E1A
MNKLWVDCCDSMVAARGAGSGAMNGTGDGIVRASRNIEGAEYASRMPEII